MDGLEDDALLVGGAVIVALYLVYKASQGVASVASSAGNLITQAPAAISQLPSGIVNMATNTVTNLSQTTPFQAVGNMIGDAAFATSQMLGMNNPNAGITSTAIVPPPSPTSISGIPPNMGVNGSGW
jgi:hypothetical protein